MEFFDDGYTATGTITEVDDYTGRRIPLAKAITFTYRPLGFAGMNRYYARVSGMKDDQAASIQAELVAKQLASWDIKDSRGQEVALNAANVGFVRMAVVNRLFNIIGGRDRPDSGGVDVATEEGN